jgi:hypothetical protein
MKRTIAGSLLFTVALAAVFALAMNGIAEAATPAQIADNLKDQLMKVAGVLYIGIIAIMSLKFLGKRQFGELGVFLCVAVVVGAFVLAPQQAMGAVKSTVNTLL